MTKSVLVVEDSPTMAHQLKIWINADEDLEVVGQAGTGAEALQRVAELSPDVITLDLGLPDMDGLTVTREVMQHHATPVVVISAAVDGPEGQAVVDALAEGAVAAIPKPEADDIVAVREMLRTIRTMADVKVISRHRRKTAVTGTWRTTPTDLIAVGVSTGGPQVLAQMLQEAPRLAVPMVIVQHISAGFTDTLVSWLNRCGVNPVQETTHGVTLRAGTVYVAAPGTHVRVGRRGEALIAEHLATQPINGFRPSVDALFESAASVVGRRTLAIILTGMGSDGVAGIAAVHEQGGQTWAQDPATCVVPGMPGSAIASGTVGEIVAPEDLASRLVHAVGRQRS